MRNRMRTPPKRLFLWLVATFAIGAIFGAGCTQDLIGEDPPDTGLYFPVNMAVSNDRFVYVLNANFDQRYNSGWISILDLEPSTGGSLYSRQAGGQLRVPSLGGDLEVDDPNAPTRLVVSHRGIGVLGLMDVAITGDGQGQKAAVTCGDPSSETDLTQEEILTDCDRNHLYKLSDAASLAGSSLTADNVRDPYALHFFRQNDQLKLAVGFLSLEYLFLLDVEASPSEQWFKRVEGYSLGAGTAGGLEALAALPGNSDYLLGTANQRSYIYTIGLQPKEDEVQGDYQRFSLGTAAAGADLVDLAFTTDSTGQRTFLYIVANTPGALALFEITMITRQLLNPDGSYDRIEEPKLHLLDILSLEGRPSGLALMKKGDTERLFVANFESDEVAVLARNGESLLVERVLGPTDGIGHGPFSVAAIDCSSWDDAECQRLVVANFFEHSLTILDIHSADAAEFKQLSVVKNDSLQ